MLIFLANHKWETFAKASIRLKINLLLAGAQRKTMMITANFKRFLEFKNLEELVEGVVRIDLNLLAVFFSSLTEPRGLILI